jgi:predicted DNA-binding transcriptional regulator AlpA
VNPNLNTVHRATAQPTTVVVQYMRNQVKAAGGDPSTVPDMPYGFMRAAKVCAMLDISIATYYRMIEDGTLPRPIPIDRASSRAAAVAA